MTIIGKVLAVLVAAASLAFLGFVSVTLTAGTNWEGEARGVELYQFTKNEGDPPTWKADPVPHDKREMDLAPVAATRVLPEAIVRAQDNIQKQYRQRIDALDQEIAQVKQEIEAYRADIAADREAVKRRQAELLALVEAADKQIEDLGKQADALSQQASAIESTAAVRREEGRRLATELELIKAEKHRWQSQKKVLEDRLVRLRQDIASLERRQAQLSGTPSPADGD